MQYIIFFSNSLVISDAFEVQISFFYFIDVRFMLFIQIDRFFYGVGFDGDCARYSPFDGKDEYFFVFGYTIVSFLFLYSLIITLDK